MGKQFASIIICTYNRAHCLRQTLLSLKNQSVSADDFEILVVDDGSSDGTVDLCKKFLGTLSNLKIISKERNQGLASAANLGIHRSRGDLLLFTDDDCHADPCWVEAMTAALSEHSIVAGAVDSHKTNLFQFCHNISQFHPFMPGQKPGKRQFIAGANMGFQRAVLEKVGGFKEGHPTPDMELIIRAGMQNYSVFFEPGARIIHDPDRRRLSDIFCYSYCHAKNTIVLRYEFQDFLRTPFILKSPFLLIAYSPVISLKVVFDIYIRNAGQLRHIRTAPVVFGLKMAWCFGAFQGLRNLLKPGKPK